MYIQNARKTERKKLTVSELTLTGLATAVLCILGPLSLPLPVSPVPISLGTLGVYLAIALLGRRLGTISCLLYLLLGMVGLPVFTRDGGGAARLLGPTGGYLVGYLFLAVIAGTFVEKASGITWKAYAFSGMGMLLGTAVLYLFGTLWLAYTAGMDFYGALWAGVIPFIPGDLLKMIAAVLLGTTLRERLNQAGIEACVKQKKH